MEGLLLDDYCIKILIVLIEEEKSHFNQLYKTLNDKKRGFKISKPTLSEHLKHLVKAGFVTRKQEEGLQLVTYSVNFDKIGKIKGLWEQQRRIVKDRKATEKEFFSLSESEQVNIVLSGLSLRKLYEIKARIDYELDPKNFEKQFAVLFWTNPTLEFVEFLMIEKCVEDKEYRKEVLKIIDKWLKPRTKQDDFRGE